MVHQSSGLKNYIILDTQSNKEIEWNNQPFSSPILFQNESQKPGQKALKKIEKHNFYLLGHPESPKNIIRYIVFDFLKS